MKQAADFLLALPSNDEYDETRYRCIESLTTAIQQATQPAEITDAMIDAIAAQHTRSVHCPTRYVTDARAVVRAILALHPTQVNTLAGCNCRWDGDNQVEWCELHLAHKEAIHEWAERAKSAEQKLALRPVQVPMTDEQAIEMNDAAFDKYMTQDARAIELVRSVEAHHGITAQAKKEGK